MKGMRGAKGLGVAAVSCLAALGLAACGSSSATLTAEHSPQVVHYALDYTPTTSNLGLYVGKALGYFSDEGIKLEILPYTNASSDSLIYSGKADFGDSYQNAVMSDQAAGEDIISIAAVLQHADSVIVYRGNDKAIKTPKDLDGLTYGAFGFPSEKALNATMIKAAGGTGNYKYVVVGEAAYPDLLSGKIDFTEAGDTWEVPQAKLEGHPYGVFKFQDYGVPDDYEEVIEAKASWLDQHQALAKKFITALQRGYQYAAAHPDKAATLFTKEVPEFKNQAKLVKVSSEELAKGWFLSPNGKWGYQTLARWKAYGDYWLSHGLLTTKTGKRLTTTPDWASEFTNKYLS